MSDQEKTAGSYTAHIGGGMRASQVAVGNDNVQVQAEHSKVQILQGPAGREASPADLEELRRLIAELKARVEAEAPPDRKAEALQQVEELHQALEARDQDPADLPDRLGGIKSWFKRNLPTLAGAVVSVIVNPIVGKVVEAAGTGLAGEIERRFAR